MRATITRNEWVSYAIATFVTAGLVYSYYDSLIRLAFAFLTILGPCCIFGKYNDRLSFRFPSAAGWLWLGYPILLVCGLFLNLTMYAQFGSSRPGALFEKPDYQARVWVYAYPDGVESRRQRVPALVRAYFEDYSEDDRTISQRVYWLDQLEFPGGRIIQFTESGESLRLNERVRLSDAQDRGWSVELTSEIVE